MLWNCENCGKTNHDSLEYCDCGSEKPGKLSPELSMRQTLRMAIMAGKATPKNRDKVQKEQKRLGMGDSTMLRLQSEVEHSLCLDRVPVVLTMERSERLSAGKKCPLHFCLESLNADCYKVSMEIVMLSESILQGDFCGSIEPGKRYDCNIVYHVPRDWSEDAITDLRLYLYSVDNIAVYRGRAEKIHLLINAPGESANVQIVNLHDYAVLAGDVSGAREKDDKPNRIDLYYDNESSERAQAGLEITEAKAPPAPAFDECFLKIRDRDGEKTLLIISRPLIGLGRSRKHAW